MTAIYTKLGFKTRISKARTAMVFALFASGFFALPAMTSAGATDSYRLCAMRKGLCKCQKVGDQPGVWVEREKVHCTPARPVSDTISQQSPKLQQSGSPALPPATPDRKTVATLQALLTRAGYSPGPADGSPGPKTAAAIRKYQKQAGLKTDGAPSLALVKALRKAPAKTVKRAKTAKQTRVKKLTQAARRPRLLERPEPAKITTPKITRNTPAPVARPRPGFMVKTPLVKVAPRPVPRAARPPVVKAATKSGNLIALVQDRLNILGYDVRDARGTSGPETTQAIKDFQGAVGMPGDGKISPLLIEKLKELASSEVSQPVYNPNQPAVKKARGGNPQPRKTVAKPVPIVPLDPELARASSGNIKRLAAPVAPSITGSINTRPPIKTTPKPAPSAPLFAASNPSEHPLSGLFANFSSQSELPTSMDGFRNCAVRKGQCLCQKRTDAPGVWTVMAPKVCAPR